MFCDNGETIFTSRFFIKDLSCITVNGVNGKLHYLAGLQLMNQTDFEKTLEG
ncbi:hypothetical protein [Mesobacillus maritimus]|uniref:hypothetical protein n=1 Tax=Mesobacillus maritimus TaxID=1643336 RepID=UPI00384C51BE